MSRRGVPMPYEHFHGGLTRPEVTRALYRQWSRQGQTREWMLKNVTNMDGRVDVDEHQWMDEHVKQMFYQMVRKLLRMSPRFGEMLDLISRASGRSQEEVLEQVRRQLWAKMQQIDDDPSHTEIFINVERKYFTFEQQQRDKTFNPPNRGPHRPTDSLFAARPRRRRPSGIDSHMWEAIYEEEQNALVPEFWDAFDAQADE